MSRFGGLDRFAACNGTTPTGMATGTRTRSTGCRCGNRRLNHVIHMAAVAQIRSRHSDGRALPTRPRCARHAASPASSSGSAAVMLRRGRS